LAIGPAPFGFVARWNGATWSSLGLGLNAPVRTIVVLSNGDLLVGGTFTAAGGQGANRIARWDGNTWSPLGAGLDGPVNRIVVLPNGDLLAGGKFTMAGSVSANNIARWDGTAWSAVGAGLTLGAASDSQVRALAALPNGDVAVGGYFRAADGRVAQHFARITTTCPATAVTDGIGCTGSGGTLTLAADALPWLGGTFKSTVTGLGASSLTFSLIGFMSPGTPLAQYHPAAGSGCDVFASPDVVVFLPSTAGAASIQFALPADPTFVGVPLHNQMVEIEIDAQGQISRINSSNGLVLTAGWF
jgi:hypothetical protein